MLHGVSSVIFRFKGIYCVCFSLASKNSQIYITEQDEFPNGAAAPHLILSMHFDIRFIWFILKGILFEKLEYVLHTHTHTHTHT
jgi:hypothetical protein